MNRQQRNTELYRQQRYTELYRQQSTMILWRIGVAQNVTGNRDQMAIKNIS